MTFATSQLCCFLFLLSRFIFLHFFCVGTAQIFTLAFHPFFLPFSLRELSDAEFLNLVKIQGVESANMFNNE